MMDILINMIQNWKSPGKSTKTKRMNFGEKTDKKLNGLFFIILHVCIENK